MNGVKLKRSQMMIRKEDNKKTTSYRKKKNNDDEKVKKTPSIGDITKYLLWRKGEDKEDGIKISTSSDLREERSTLSVRKMSDIGKEYKSVRRLVSKFENSSPSMKKTFATGGEDNQTISRKIENFKQLSMESDKCLIGSGRCAKHNTRVVRLVKDKKTSVVKKMCEVVILACSAVNRDMGTSAVSEHYLSDKEDVIANKRARVNDIIDVSQSDLSKLEKEEACDVTIGLK